MQTKSHNKKTKTILLISLLSVACAAALYYFIASANSLWPYQARQSKQTQNLDTKTNADKNKSDPTYQSTKNTPTTTPSSSNSQDNNPTDKLSAQVGIASASVQSGKLEIRAFISGVIEGDGTCTAVVQQNSTIVRMSSSGFIDASTTQCEPITIDTSKLGGGTWNVTVQYQSNKYQGVSSAVQVNI